eukprot:GEMP01039367.1.p1 GENE.GEMP01039367.1~~GEMP01039367.1.p1  ORF type:complete len:251 (+),score=50.22 GEMP01039367.1:125-877(+)
MPTPQAVKDLMRLQWLQRFQQAVQYDTWGQIVEAQEGYRNLAAAIAAKQGQVFINSAEKDTLHRLVLCLSARVQAVVSANNGMDIMSATDMKALEKVFESLFTGDEPASASAFPVSPVKFHSVAPIKPSQSEGEIICGEKDETYSDFFHSHHAVTNVKGTVVSLRLDRIGLKDAQVYIDPFITILVVDDKGVVVDKHDIPTAKERKSTHVMFNSTVYLTVPYEEMQKTQASIFLEFKHFKPKKKKISTRL